MYQASSAEFVVPRSTEERLDVALAAYGPDRQRCVAVLRELVEVEHDRAWPLLRAGKLLLAAREPELARVALTRAAGLGRHLGRRFDADLTHARGLLAAQERSDRTAERYLRSAHAAEPTYSVFAASVVEFLVQRRRADEAYAFAERVESRLADQGYFQAIRRGLHV
jgi:hypothetical protein